MIYYMNQFHVNLFIFLLKTTLPLFSHSFLMAMCVKNLALVIKILLTDKVGRIQLIGQAEPSVSGGVNLPEHRV